MAKPEYAAFPLDITVRFAETDQMGVVHHSEYVVWFEAGRVAWMAAVGMPYTEIAGAGYNFAVTDLQCRYRNAIRFGDAVQVITRLGSLRSRQVEFVYEIRNPHTGGIYADGHTQHICVDGDGRMTRLPDWIAQRFLGNASIPAPTQQEAPSRRSPGAAAPRDWSAQNAA